MKTLFFQFVVDLKHAIGNNNGMFVIGNNDLSAVKIISQWGGVQSWKKFTKSAEEAKNFLGDDSRAPYGIALLYGSHQHRHIQLTEDKPFIRLRDSAETVARLKNTLVDFVLVGTESIPNVECPIYDELHEWSNKHYMLRRSFGSHGNRDDLSLSRCPDNLRDGNNQEVSTRFAPHLFKLAIATPGRENECDPSNAYVLHADPLLDLGEVVVNMPGVTDLLTQAAEWEQCAADLLREAELLSDTDVQMEEVSDDDECAEDVDTSISFVQREHNYAKSDNCPANAAYSADLDSDRLDSSFGQQVEKPWQSVKHFKPEWLKLSAEHHEGRMPLGMLAKPKFQYWMVYYVNDNNPALTRYGCWMCEKYYSMTEENKQYHRSDFAKPHGTEVSRIFRMNWAKILNHDRSLEHSTSVQFIIEQHEQGYSDIFINAQRMQECRDKIHAPTRALLRTVYCESKVNLAFASHGSFLKLQRLNGVELGQHYYHDKNAQKITAFFSQQMHENLLEHLRTENPPVSLMCDESTDQSEHNYMIMLLQAPEKNRPMIYFYRLARTTSDLSAHGLTDLILSQFEKDDMTEFFKENLHGLTSDGAGVFRGKVNSVCVHMNEFTHHKLYCKWCVSHRINLAGKHSIKQETHYQMVEELVHKVYLMYNSHAQKRKTHLEETARKIGLHLYALSDIYAIRWQAADLKAFKKLCDNWVTLITDLREIAESDSFTLGIKERAERLEGELTSRHMLVHLHFALDILEVLSKWSVQSQKSSALIFDKADMLDEALEDVEKLRDTNPEGGHLDTFLKQLVCWNDVEGGTQLEMGCTEEQLYSFDKVSWRNVQLEDKDAQYGMPRLNVPRPPRIETVRKLTINLLIEKIHDYSKDREDLVALSIFEPTKIPYQVHLWQAYGNNEIKHVAKILGYHDDYQEELADEWDTFLKNLVSHPDYPNDRKLLEDKKLNTKSFWQKYLSLPRDDFNFPEMVKKILKICLALPGSNADSERGFSIMKYVRPQARNQLKGSSIEDLMRIRMNGPSLEKFNVNYYTSKWLAKGHILVDDPTKRGNRAAGQCQDNDEEEQLSGKSLLF